MPIDSLVGQQQTANTQDWRQMTKTLMVSGSEFSVRLRGIRGTDFSSDMAIDDLLVRETPTCFEPTNLMAVATSTSATLSWNDPNSATNWQIVYSAAAGFSPDTAAKMLVSNPTTITGLMPETSYGAYVRAICAVGDTSGWSSLVSFTTPCAALALPFSEDFENGFTGTTTIPDCWKKINLGAAGFTWTRDQGPTPSTSSGPTGPLVDHTFGTSTGRYMFTESSSGATGDATLLEAPNLSIAGTNTVNVSFWYHMYGPTMGTLVLETSTDGGTWMPVESLVGQQQTANTQDWRQMTKTLMVSGSEFSVRLRGIRGTSFSSDMAIDDLKVRSATTWTGTMWTNGTPNADMLAIIAGNYSNGSFITNDLIINSGVAFMPTGDIDIKGTYTKKGNATVGGAGFVSFSGAGVQTVSGDFMKLKINNTTGATITGPTSVSGVLKLENGTLTTNGNLTLASPSASQCACLDTMKVGGGTLSGDVTVERSLPQGVDRWFYMATPVKGKFFGDLLLGNITFKPYNIYEYSPITNVDSGWVAADSFTALTPGQGAIAFGNSGKLDYTGAVTIGDGAGNTAGNFDFGVTYSESGWASNGLKGWNLLGNPYPCNLNWDAMSRTDVENSFWLWDGEGYQFFQTGGTTGGSNGGGDITGNIPSGQAFFTRAFSTGTPSLTASEEDKNPTVSPSMLSTSTSDRLGMTIHQLDASGNSLKSDRGFVRFDAAATVAYDNNADLVKLFNPELNLSSYQTAGNRLAVNVLPFNQSSVKLSVTGNTGSYSLNFDGLGSFAAGSQFFLQDKHLNTITDLTQQGNYAFSITGNVASQGDDRFELVLIPMSVTGLGNGTTTSKSAVSVYPNPARDWFEIRVSVDTQGQTLGTQTQGIMSLLNTTGQIVKTVRMDGNSQRVRTDDLPAGVYMVQVRTNNGVTTKKLVIKK